jgi:hypothetical protein
MIALSPATYSVRVVCGCDGRAGFIIIAAGTSAVFHVAIDNRAPPGTKETAYPWEALGEGEGRELRDCAQDSVISFRKDVSSLLKEAESSDEPTSGAHS